MENIVD